MANRAMDLRTGVVLDLATLDNGDLNLEALDRCLPEWRYHRFTAPAEVGVRLQGAQVVITNKVALDQAAFEAAPELKLVVVAATGVNVIDLDAARESGVRVCNVRDYCSASLAQHVLTLALNLVTGQPWYAQRARNGEWLASGSFSLHERPIRELGRLSLGIIGYGVLGQAVARLARSLGMNVLIGGRRDQPPRPDRLAFKDLVANADIISLHCPLTPETRHLIDREVLRTMKRDAILINTARGGLVHEQDLADALRAGEIGGAGLDVLSVEPPSPDHPLLAADIPNLILTPHNAWASTQARQALVDQLLAVIRAFQRGQPINLVG